jgi:L-lactate dehydrogenase
MRIVEAILRDQRTILSVSSLVENYFGISDVSFSLPTVIDRSRDRARSVPSPGRKGTSLLQRSATILKDTIGKLDRKLSSESDAAD